MRLEIYPFARFNAIQNVLGPRPSTAEKPADMAPKRASSATPAKKAAAAAPTPKSASPAAAAAALHNKSGLPKLHISASSGAASPAYSPTVSYLEGKKEADARAYLPPAWVTRWLLASALALAWLVGLAWLDTAAVPALYPAASAPAKALVDSAPAAVYLTLGELLLVVRARGARAERAAQRCVRRAALRRAVSTSRHANGHQLTAATPRPPLPPRRSSTSFTPPPQSRPRPRSWA